jgi:hypothetical protein
MAKAHFPTHTTSLGVTGGYQSLRTFLLIAWRWGSGMVNGKYL